MSSSRTKSLASLFDLILRKSAFSAGAVLLLKPFCTQLNAWVMCVKKQNVSGKVRWHFQSLELSDLASLFGDELLGSR